MSRYFDNATVSPEPLSDQERRDLAEERDDEAFAAMYETVKAEREAVGLGAAPLKVCVEARRRLSAETK